MTRFEARIDDMATNKPRAAGNNNFHDELEIEVSSYTKSHGESCGNWCYLETGQTLMSFEFAEQDFKGVFFFMQRGWHEVAFLLGPVPVERPQGHS